MKCFTEKKTHGLLMDEKKLNHIDSQVNADLDHKIPSSIHETGKSY